MKMLSATMLPHLVSMFLVLLHDLTGIHGDSLALGSVQNDTLVVREGDTVVLPCVLPSKENIKENVFDWKKDGQKEVFMYDSGDHYNNGRSGQDKQYIGRTLYFEEQLKFGNASLILMNAMVADSGRYSCHFPHLNVHTSYVTLLVSAAPQPRTKFVNVTEDGVKLMCEVRGAFPKPEVEWHDSNGRVIPVAEPKAFIDSEGHYNITLSVIVTKPDHYRCIAKQEKINHMIYDEIYVHERMFCNDTSWRVIVGVLAAVIVILVLLVAMMWITISGRKDSLQQQCCTCRELNPSKKPLTSDHSPDA